MSPQCMASDNIVMPPGRSWQAKAPGTSLAAPPSPDETSAGTDPPPSSLPLDTRPPSAPPGLAPASPGRTRQSSPAAGAVRPAAALRLFLAPRAADRAARNPARAPVFVDTLPPFVAPPANSRAPLALR